MARLEEEVWGPDHKYINHNVFLENVIYKSIFARKRAWKSINLSTIPATTTTLNSTIKSTKYHPS